jgi:hypothetical protein
MKIWVRKPGLTLIGAAAIALAWVGWSGSQEAHMAGLRSPAVVGAAASAPAAALRAPGPRDSQFAKCGGADCVATSKPAALVDCVQCLSEADGALFEAESVSAGEPWSTIVVGGLVGALPDVYDGPNVSRRHRAGRNGGSGLGNFHGRDGGAGRRPADRPAGRPEPLGVMEGALEGFDAPRVRLNSSGRPTGLLSARASRKPPSAALCAAAASLLAADAVYYFASQNCMNRMTLSLSSRVQAATVATAQL